MKKLPGLLLILLVALQPGCRKNNDSVAEVKAQVRYSNPDVDGIGYSLLLDGTSETVIPINLPSSYKQNGVGDAVAVKLIDTGKRFHLGYSSVGLRGVYIVTIRKL
jgi:hypothetical protein